MRQLRPALERVIRQRQDELDYEQEQRDVEQDGETGIMEPWQRYCVMCDAIVDTREVEDGGGPEGAQLDEDSWVCSAACWDEAMRDLTPNAPALKT